MGDEALNFDLTAKKKKKKKKTPFDPDAGDIEKPEEEIPQEDEEATKKEKKKVEFEADPVAEENVDDIDLESFGTKKKKKKKRGEGLENLDDLKESLPEEKEDKPAEEEDLDLDSFGTKKKKK